MATLLTLAQRLWRESGRINVKPDSVASATGDGLRMVEAIQDAWRNIELMPRNWRWMRATASGETTADDGAYTAANLGVSSGFGHWVRQSDYYGPYCYLTAEPGGIWELQHLPLEQFTRRYLREPVTSGRPEHWTEAANGSLLIGPPPDSDDYTIKADYFKAPTELTVDASTPAMPGEYHLLIMWKALEQIAIGDEAANHVTRARMNAKALMAAMLDTQADNPTMHEWGPLA